MRTKEYIFQELIHIRYDLAVSIKLRQKEKIKFNRAYLRSVLDRLNDYDITDSNKRRFNIYIASTELKGGKTWKNWKCI